MNNMNRCPACDREFRYMDEFPLIYVLDVSIIKPEEVPDFFPHWNKKRVQVEENQELTQFFKENLDIWYAKEDDGMVYSRNPLDDLEFGNKKENWNNPSCFFRSKDWIPEVKELLTTHQQLNQYFSMLQELVEKEVPSKDIFPDWKFYPRDDEFERNRLQNDRVYSLLNTDKLGLNFRESDSRDENLRLCEIVLVGEGKILDGIDVGKIKYEGRVHQT